MEIKEIKNEKLDREISITIPSSKIEDLYNKKLEENSKFIKLQGFRPGKAPKNVVEQKYGKSIYSEVLDEQINNSSREALKDFKIFGEPRLLDFQGERGSDVLFKLAFEVYPQIKIPEFKKITVKKPVISKVKDDLIEKRKNDIISGYFEKEPLEDENAKTQKEDMLVADFDLFSTDGKDKINDNPKSIIIRNNNAKPNPIFLALGRSFADSFPVTMEIKTILSIPSIISKKVRVNIAMSASGANKA
jgi:trigger factor